MFLVYSFSTRAVKSAHRKFDAGKQASSFAELVMYAQFKGQSNRATVALMDFISSGKRGSSLSEEMAERMSTALTTYYFVAAQKICDEIKKKLEEERDPLQIKDGMVIYEIEEPNDFGTSPVIDQVVFEINHEMFKETKYRMLAEFEKASCDPDGHWQRHNRFVFKLRKATLWEKLWP